MVVSSQCLTRDWSQKMWEFLLLRMLSILIIYSQLVWIESTISTFNEEFKIREIQFSISLQRTFIDIILIFNLMVSQYLDIFAEWPQDPHNLWPPTPSTFLGLFLLAIITLLSSIAGLGGGVIALPVLTSFFYYSPKQATIISSCAILGSSVGNVWNSMQKVDNGKTVIHYEQLFIIIPIMFTGALVGIIINSLLPVITICFIVFYLFGKMSGSILQRFKNEYSKQNEENSKMLKKHKQDIKKQQNSESADKSAQKYAYNGQTSKILFNLLFVTLFILFISLSRGSTKMPSILGIQPCSAAYWGITIGAFVFMIYISYRNVATFQVWQKAKPIENQITPQNKNELFKKSLFAGIMSGFGIGGGFIIIPMLRKIGLKQFEATVTCSFAVCLTSLINCGQGMAIGVINFKQIFFFVFLLSLVASQFSGYVRDWLIRINRMSYLTALFYLFFWFGLINVPLSVYRRYASSGYQWNSILGWGSLC